MLALCLMLSMTDYAQNYAGIIGRSLNARDKGKLLFIKSGVGMTIIYITSWANTLCINNQVFLFNHGTF